ncbi:MAG: ABC transporter permease subunit [Limisphaerales bacterium]
MSYASRLSRVTFCSFLVVLLVAAGSHSAFADDSLAKVTSSGVLTWGGDAEGGAPYVYPNPDRPDEVIGFEKELADALAAKLGVKAKFVQNQWDQLMPALDRGGFDIILNGLELTTENQRHIAMSFPYFVYAQQIVVLKDTRGLDSLERLKGHFVGVLSASVSWKLLTKSGGTDLGSYPGNVETLRDLKAHRIDAAVMDLPAAQFYAKPDAELKYAGKSFAPGYYAIGVRRADKTLLAAINKALIELANDGTYERIYSKYGVWDARQIALTHRKAGRAPAKAGSEKAEANVTVKNVSTMREWSKYLPLLLRGAVVTVEISVLAMALAVVVGLVVVLMRLYGIAPLRWFAKAYVEVMRGTPLLIQLFLIYYGLPQIGIRLNAFIAAIIGLGLNYAANEAENYRAGIQAVPHGQTEAAQALGMTRKQYVRHIILPQAMRMVIPPVTNDFIAMFKDSSIVSVITMVELTKVYGMLAMSTYDYIGLGLMTAAIYFALSYPASIFANYLERRLAYDRR